MRSLLLAVVILAALPVSVCAHVLPTPVAAAKARSEALIISGALPQRSRVSVRTCRRLTRHIVDCRVRYRFLKDGKLTGEQCFQTIRVRYTSDRSRRLTVTYPPASVRC